MLEFYLKTKNDTEFRQGSEFCPGCLVYVKQATAEDLEKINQAVHQEIGDIFGSLDKYEIPRIEKHADNFLLFIRHPSEQEKGLHTEPLTLILTSDYLIAISPYLSPLIDQMLSLGRHLLTTDRLQILLYLLMRISNQFTASIKQVRHSILLYEEPSQMPDNRAIIELTKNEEILNQYLGALVSMRNLLSTLTAHNLLNLPEKDQDTLQDILIAISQSEELCRVNVRSIRSLRDSYQIIFTNDVSKTIRRLTAITIIISIPTMIASVYGMNIVMPLSRDPYAFFYISGGAIFCSVLSIFIFLKNRWL
jgi:magnesium transporter